jgi:hypothetical protein
MWTKAGFLASEYHIELHEDGKYLHSLRFHVRAEKTGKLDRQESEMPCFSFIVGQLG